MVLYSSFFLEILEYETCLFESAELYAEDGKDTLEKEQEQDHLACTLLRLFFRALLQLCPALKRVHVTFLSETDVMRFIVHISDLERLVRGTPCIHVENLFFLGRQAVFSDRQQPVVHRGDRGNVFSDRQTVFNNYKPVDHL
jgi:hypothetical protein